ncbi:GNAT family N-acetyltransferase [Psychrobacillus psychrotolerans]|uniref:GNAT family N-acetyltransferase n=1 Tax=Psychrobacillus psychrotolerans TaxID=126156 RepID=UPI003B02E88A
MKVIGETERLFLCVFEQSHVEAAQQFWADEEVMSLCDGPSAHELLPKVIAGYRKLHEDRGLSVYAVIEKESDLVIGAAGFNPTDSTGVIELIYHFSKKSWGKGFASEAAAACLKLAKNKGNIRIITASADPKNIGSLKILEKIGFTYVSMKWFEDTKQEEPYYEYLM